MSVRPVNSNAVSGTRPYAFGDRVRTRGDDPETMRKSLPALPAGLAWAMAKRDSTSERGGPSVDWKVVYEGDLPSEDRSAQAAAAVAFWRYEKSALERRLVADGEPMPIARAGYEWRLLHHWPDSRKSEYGLFREGAAGPEATRVNLPVTDPANTRRAAVMNSIQRFEAMQKEAITTRLVRDGEPLPTARSGYEWRLISPGSDIRSAEYGLYAVK